MKRVIAFLISASLLFLAFFVYSGREKETEAGAFGEGNKKEYNVTGLVRSLIDKND